jgi:hypothetical protein
LDFTCHKDNIDWVLIGNRPTVPFWSPRPIDRLVLQVSAGSESPITLSSKPLYEAKKWGEQEPVVWGEEQEKAFKKIKRALTNAC